MLLLGLMISVSHSRKKIFAVGYTFAIVVMIFYFLFITYLFQGEVIKKFQKTLFFKAEMSEMPEFFIPKMVIKSTHRKTLPLGRG